MRVSDYIKSKVYFHLGYGNLQGIPVGDVAALNNAMDNVFSDGQYNFIKQIVDRCDIAWANTQPGELSSVVDTYSGDINRTVLHNDLLKTYRDLWEIYTGETDMLAAEFNAVNYRHQDSRRLRFAAFGGEYLQSLPGTRDTSVGTKLYLFNNFA